MTKTQGAQPKKSGPRRYLPILVIAVVAIIGAITLHDFLSFETLRDNREALMALRDDHYAFTVLIFLLVYIAVVAFSLPGATVVSLAGGFLFGTVLGTGYNVFGATAGATLIFLAARLGLGDRLKARLEGANGTVRRVKRGLDENQWSMLFFIRLVPAVPFFVANLIPALLAVPLHRYVISTFFGIIPGALIFTSVGAGLGEVFARGESPDLDILFEPYVLFPLLGLCALSLLPVLYKLVTGKKDLLK